MWPVSRAFNAAARESHQAIARAEVWSGPELLTTLAVTSGSVSVDRTRAIRRTLSLTVVEEDTALLDDGAAGILSPYGNECRVYRGFQLETGPEYAPLGVFGIAGVKAESGASGLTISVEGSDRARRVVRNRFVTPWQIAAGTDVATAVEQLLLSRYPDIEYDFALTGDTVNATILEAGESSDPWRDAQAIAQSAGLELAFDPSGVCRLYEPADPVTGAPVATYTDVVDCALLSVTRDLDTETTYNGVIASGESSGLVVPVQGIAWDDDPSSPTFRGGPYGEVPYFYVSPFISKVGQATRAAESLLAQVAGASEKIEWTQVVNPAHDADDLIDIQETKTRTTARVTLDAFTVPLGSAEAMSSSARVRRVF
jgi:hypothetical protein